MEIKTITGDLQEVETELAAWFLAENITALNQFTMSMSTVGKEIVVILIKTAA